MNIYQTNSEIRAYAKRMAWSQYKFRVFLQVINMLGQRFGVSDPQHASSMVIVSSIAGSLLWYFVLKAWLSKGYAYAMLKILSGRTARYKDLVVGSNDYKRSLIAVVLMSAKTVLWALLLFVPGVIAYYKYILTFFVMTDRPDLTGAQCIQESCRLMRGNKLRLFKMLLWYYVISCVISVLLYGALWALFRYCFGINDLTAASVASIVSLAVADVVMNSLTYPATAQFYRVLTIGDK